MMVKDVEVWIGKHGFWYQMYPWFYSVIKNSLLQIEKYMFHILKMDELFNRLSKEEKSFAER